MKKGGSKWSKSQPFLRCEFFFKKNYKMEKLLNCIYNPEHIKKWDKLIKGAKRISIDNKHAYGYQYLVNIK